MWRLKIDDSPVISGHRPPASIVVVDAKTFMPIQWTGYSSAMFTRHGPFKVLSRTVTEYVLVQRLAATPANRALLRMTDHPGAKTGPQIALLLANVCAK